ncbi:hypothetical protein EDD75_0704 [Thermodesulfitimonas autotrophica]|uniref:Uncharacterized protein n=1 Tax=Thermodesulfitimonas autotrophica TaxID=1894989 RepID=A0A3N5BJJ1_9THEO|nr:hypothetical protein [Thermodesulfitimonas autotrophica]RPF49878.1 hypothetical protein EDD75_0704 [Thermodesulfitimonas autotrophica]
MLFQSLLMEILSPAEEAEKTEKLSGRQSLMQRLAAKFDLSVTDLWILIFTVLALAMIYGIGEIALALS